MNGQTVVTVDGQKLGHVVDDHDDCAVVENGHLRKTQHAIPHELLHDGGEEIRATVSKEIVESSPRAEDGAFDREAVLQHYGLIGAEVVDPDPDGVHSAEAQQVRAGVVPAQAERAALREGTAHEPEPTIVEKLPGGANDPSGTTSNYH